MSTVITKEVLDAVARSYTAFDSDIATRPREWAKSMEIRPHPGAAVRKVYHKVYQNQPDSELTLTISTGYVPYDTPDRQLRQLQRQEFVSYRKHFYNS